MSEHGCRRSGESRHMEIGADQRPPASLAMAANQSNAKTGEGPPMAVEWRIKATEFANCNCIYACPCQFNALPTNGNCHAAGAWQVEEGHFGTVRLDGLRAVALYNFPGPVHEGNGTMQVIVDERADA